MSWLTASYLVEADAASIAAKAAAIASEQSVECPLEAIHDERIREDILARVLAIEPVDAGRYRVDVGIATQTIGHNPVQFLNMTFGNASLWDDVQLLDVALPDELLHQFAGPHHGIAGLRAILGVPERALTCAAMKPQGMLVPELAALCATFAAAGVDIIKDDHGIDDQWYAPFRERVWACQAAITNVNLERGTRSLYAPSLVGTPQVLRERAEIAREAGVRVVLVAPMLVGLPAFLELVETFPELVFLAHPSHAGARRIDVAFLFGRLLRLFGADATIFVNYGGRFGYPQATCGALADAARAPWGHLAPTLPVPAGGMTVDRIEELLGFYGPDTMLLIGGNLLIDQAAIGERTRAFVDRVAAFRFPALSATG